LAYFTKGIMQTPNMKKIQHKNLKSLRHKELKGLVGAKLWLDYDIFVVFFVGVVCGIALGVWVAV